MKIFGIGLSKTGTTSLAHALEILGYRTKDYPGIKHYRPGDLSSIGEELLEEYDAFTDTPIPSFYRELDVRYPGSKFILTTREIDGWLKSCKKQFTEKLANKQNDAHNNLFLELYGCTVFDEQKFRTGYENYTSSVLRYFRERPDDLLILDVTEGCGWEKLCPFFGQTIPDIAFPKSNVTQIRWMNVNDIIEVAYQAGKDIRRAYAFIQENNIEQSRHKKRLFGIARINLKKPIYSLRGGPNGLRQRVINRAHRLILKKLQVLTPKIPVISRERNAIPYVERSKWNHFWLVDTFDDDEMLLKPEAVFTISIALIEDRKPILGVVYAPALETIYHAMAGKGAFKIVHGETPRQLRLIKEESNEHGTLLSRPELSASSQKAHRLGVTSKAFSLCLVAEGILDINQSMKETMEWQTAGANAVVNYAGMKIISHNTNEELAYNKVRLDNGPIVIEQ